MSCILLKPACEADFLGYMDDKASNELIFFLVWPLPETAMGMLLRNRLVGALGALPCKHYVVRFIPLVRSEGSPPSAQMSFNSTASHGDRLPQKRTVPWLSSSRGHWRVFQLGCQPTPTQPRRTLI